MLPKQNEYKQEYQQVHMTSLYYYTVPNPIVNPLYTMMTIDPFKCPCYVPIAADYCRYCQTRQHNHRKYYLYSHYVRKIQLQWIDYQFQLFSKRIYQKYSMLLYPETVLLKIFHKKYYRNWNVYNWEYFLKQFQGNAFKKENKIMKKVQ
jgi:hypothetical protein